MGRASPKIRVEPSSAPHERAARVASLDRITVVGARQHNLQDVTISLPRGKLVVLTGPSGSGKSSLAFDTIYAEGQRRYVESLSAYARQFLEQLAEARRRAHRRPLARDRDRAAPAFEIAALHGRHRHGDRRLPARPLRARGRPPLSELRQAHRGADGPADRRSNPLARRGLAHPLARAGVPRAKGRAQARARAAAARGLRARADRRHRSSTSATRSSSIARSRTTSTSSSIASSSRTASKGA